MKAETVKNTLRTITAPGTSAIRIHQDGVSMIEVLPDGTVLLAGEDAYFAVLWPNSAVCPFNQMDPRCDQAEGVALELQENGYDTNEAMTPDQTEVWELLYGLLVPSA